MYPRSAAIAEAASGRVLADDGKQLVPDQVLHDWFELSEALIGEAHAGVEVDLL